MDVQLKRGILDACVLTVLRRGESYGYRLVRDVEAARLLTVRSAEHNGRLRKYYQITQAGEARVHAFLEEWRVLMRALGKIEAEVEGHDQA